MALRDISQDEIAEMQLYIVELEQQRRCDEARLQKLSMALEETKNHKTEVVSSFSSTKNYQQLRSCADSAIDGTVATATMMIQRMKSTHQDEVERIQSQIEQERQSHRAARAIETAQREEETRKLQSQIREQKESIGQLENRLKEKDDKLCEVDRELRKERESLKKIQLLNATMQREIEDLKSRENARNETACTNGEKLKNGNLLTERCERLERRGGDAEHELIQRKDTKACLKELETMLHQKSEQIAKCEEELATLNLTLKANLSAMQQMEKVIEIKESRISKYVRELKEKDGITTALRTQLSKEKKRLKEQLELVCQRDDEIARLQKVQKTEVKAAAKDTRQVLESSEEDETIESRVAKDDDPAAKERMEKLVADLENQVRTKHEELCDRSREIKEYQSTIRSLEVKLEAKEKAEKISRDTATSLQSHDALEQQVSTLKEKVSRLESSLTMRENSLKAMRLDKTNLKKLLESSQQSLKQTWAKLSVDMPQLQATTVSLRENLAMKSNELEALQLQKHKMQQLGLRAEQQAPEQYQAPEAKKGVSENSETKKKRNSKKKNKKPLLQQQQNGQLAAPQGNLIVDNQLGVSQTNGLKQTLQSQLLQMTKNRETVEKHDDDKDLENGDNDDLSDNSKVNVLHIENQQLLDAISQRDKELANLKLKATEAEKVYSKSLSGMEALCSERDQLLENYESCKEESRTLQDRIGELETRMAEMVSSPPRSPPLDNSRSPPTHRQAAKKEVRGTRSLSPTQAKATTSSPSSLSLSSPESYGRTWRPLPRPRVS